MSVLSNLPIKVRLYILVSVLAVLAIVIGILGLSGMHHADEQMDEMYHGNVHHTHLLAMVAEHTQELRTLLLLSLQHDPTSEIAKLHDHPVTLHLDAIRKNMHLVEEEWNEYLADPVPAEIQDTTQTVTKQLDTVFDQGFEPAMTKLEGGDYRAAALILLNVINPAYNKLVPAVGMLMDVEEEESGEVFHAAEEEHSGMVTTVVALLVLGVVASVAFAYFIILGISRGVHSIERVANNLADGDLTQRVDYSSQDEIGHIAEAFNRMAEKFNLAINQVKESISQLASAAEETSVVNAQTTSGINQQQMETSQVASAITEMNSTVHEVARSAVAAAEAAKEANESFTDGKQVVDGIIHAIGDLADEVEQSSQVIRELEQESVNIGSVLDVIKGIAEQTNLLALNAAIEAARAGEQGRGFAVVADEVRTLAGRTQQSTSEIEEMINRLQGGANKAVQVMDSGKQKSLDGVEQASAAADALEVIKQAVDHITTMNTQIASAAEEQSAVTEEINRNIVNINQVAEQTAEGASQANQASNDLARLAEQLKELASQFKV